MKRICVYCGSNPGRLPAYTQAARSLAQALVARGLALVYGGAKVGIMGTIADEVLACGGEVLGIIPQSLVTKELAHPGLTQLYIVTSMHERKAKMADLSDGFIAMPGGLGTLEEIFEVMTWAQLGFHHKPCGLLNIADYFAGLATFLSHSVAEGFVRQDHRDMLMIESQPETLLDRFAIYQPPLVGKWLDRHQT